MTLTMLNRMVHHLDFTHSIQIATWAAIVLSFHLLLKKSNLVPNTAVEFSPIHQMVWKDIHFYSGLVLVNVKWLKNRQIGHYAPLRRKGPACPVAALKRLFLVVNAQPQEPLFAFQCTKPYSHTHLSVLTYPSLMLYF